MAELLKPQDFEYIIIHCDIQAQLKEIVKRIHVSAYTLEGMAIKVI